jgi:type II secretory pathway component GspD/PulD (secretin)
VLFKTLHPTKRYLTKENIEKKRCGKKFWGRVVWALCSLCFQRGGVLRLNKKEISVCSVVKLFFFSLCVLCGSSFRKKGCLDKLVEYQYHKYVMKRVFLLIFIFCSILNVKAQEERRISVSFEDLPAQQAVQLLNQKYGSNIVIRSDVQGSVTLFLSDVTVEQLLTTLAQSLGCSVSREENVYYLTRGKAARLDVIVEDGLLTLDCDDVEIDRLLREISKQSGLTIIAGGNVRETRISGYLKEVPVVRGLEAFLTSKGFEVIEREGFIEVLKIEERGRERTSRRRSSSQLRISRDTLISIDVKDMELEKFIDDISKQTKMNIVTYGELTGKVSATIKDQPLSKALDLILSGTNYGFKKIEDVYVIGKIEGKAPGEGLISSVTLIPLKYIKADDAFKLLPSTISPSNIKVVEEHNAFLCSVIPEQFRQINEFIGEVDVPAKRVRMRAIILSVSRKKLSELGINAGENLTDKTDNVSEETGSEEFKITFDKEDIDDIIEYISNSLNLGTSVEIPTGFRIMINALEQRGLAKVHAEPSIVTISGQKASIDVGWRGYYRTRVGTAENPLIQVHSVEAGIKLIITPWVGKENDVTADVEVEVSSLKGISSDGLPELSRRSVKTTLKLQEGETAIIGGLIEKTETINKNKVPLLGDIPIIGDFLFSSQSINVDESELIIYLTPEIVPWQNVE